MNKEEYYTAIQESASFIRSSFEGELPKVAIITGTGLGGIVEAVENKEQINYERIPNFPKSTVQSHKGQLIKGTWQNSEVLILAGRWHYYEGYSTKELTLPIRVLKTLGVKTLILTNVTGAVNPDFEAGDLVVVRDHINLIPDHPLRGPNDDRLGPRFPDMMHAYDPELRALTLSVAKEKNITIHEGVYLALQGPSLETPAEYAFIHNSGADLVGMSTVPEVIVARHSDLRVLTLSIVSNVCYPLSRLTETTVEEVIEVANKAGIKLQSVLASVIGKISSP